MDEVVIQTENSTYGFLIIDPDKRHGVLTGGRVGNRPRHAVFTDAFVASLDDEVESSHDLSVGARALFYILSLGQTELLATSPIQKIGVIRNEQEVLRIRDPRADTTTFLN
jgi:hypothetical protein